MASHSSILAWRTSWTKKPGGYSPCSHGVAKEDTTWQLNNKRALELGCSAIWSLNVRLTVAHALLGLENLCVWGPVFLIGNSDQNHLLWPGTIITICMNYESHYRRSWSGGRYILPTSQTPSRWNPSWLRDACPTRKNPDQTKYDHKQDDWPESIQKLTPPPP